GRCLTVLREGEGVHRGAWLELPEQRVTGTIDEALGHLVETHLERPSSESAAFEARGTFHGRGDAFDANVEVHALLGQAGGARAGSFLSLDEIRARWRSGEALLSPALAAYVSLGGAPRFERECWEVT